jgi:hypothetical protein
MQRAREERERLVGRGHARPDSVDCEDTGFDEFPVLRPRDRLDLDVVAGLRELRVPCEAAGLAGRGSPSTINDLDGIQSSAASMWFPSHIADVRWW